MRRLCTSDENFPAKLPELRRSMISVQISVFQAFEMVFLIPESVFDTILKCWWLKHGVLGCGVDEVPTTALPILYITGLEHEGSDTGVGFCGV